MTCSEPPPATLVSLRGEHDVATKESVADCITRAAALDDADVLVDLSDVTFLDASTIGVLVDTRNRLCARSRSLYVRSPSPLARRVLDLCDVADLEQSATSATAIRPNAEVQRTST